MAKNAVNMSQPHDQPNMVVPGELAYRENEMFFQDAVNGYSKNSFAGDTPAGKLKGNRNTSGFPPQNSDPVPYGRLRRK